jgi:hypothetical protein
MVPYLRPARQVVTFDFLGWGTSDKPVGYPYTATNQTDDLDAVIRGGRAADPHPAGLRRPDRRADQVERTGREAASRDSVGRGSPGEARFSVL